MAGSEWKRFGCSVVRRGFETALARLLNHRSASERGLVGADTRGGPGVVRRGTARAAGRSALGGRGRRGPRVVVGRRGLAALLTAVRRTTRPLRAGHLGGGVAQRRTDLVDLDLEDGALLTLTRLVLTRA